MLLLVENVWVEIVSLVENVWLVFENVLQLKSFAGSRINLNQQPPTFNLLTISTLSTFQPFNFSFLTFQSLTTFQPSTPLKEKLPPIGSGVVISAPTKLRFGFQDQILLRLSL